MQPRPPVDESEILKQIQVITNSLRDLQVDNETIQQIRKNLRDEYINCKNIQAMHDNLALSQEILNSLLAFQKSPLPYDVIRDRAEFERGMTEIGYEEAGKNIQSTMKAAKLEIYKQCFEFTIDRLKGAPAANNHDGKVVSDYLNNCSKIMEMSTQRLLGAIESTMKMHQAHLVVIDKESKLLEKQQDELIKMHERHRDKLESVYQKHQAYKAKWKRMDGAMLVLAGCALAVSGCLLAPLSLGASMPLSIIGGWLLGNGLAKLATSSSPAVSQKMLSKAATVVVDVQSNIANVNQKRQLENASANAAPPTVNRK